MTATTGGMTATTISTKAPDAPPLSDAPLTGRGTRTIFIALMLGMSLAALDQTIVATALPTIVGDLGGLNHISWVVTSYLLASTVSTPLYGKLGDMLGRKPVFLAAILIFLAGSMLAGLSQSMDQLIGFRAMQGIGAGGLVVGAQAIIADIVPPRERGRYTGLIGSVFAVASIVGPLLGGFFVESLSWRWIFYVNLPLGSVAIAIVVLRLHLRAPHKRHRIDYVGAALLSGAVTCVILAATWAGNEYAWGSSTIVGLIGFGLVLLALFVWQERRATEPILPLGLFRSSIFSVSSAMGFAMGAAMFSAVVYIPVYLQLVDGASPTSSGLRMLPLIVGALVTAVCVGRTISAIGRYRKFPIAGTASLLLGMFLLSRIGVGTAPWLASAYMLLVGIGIGLVMPVITLAIQNSVRAEDVGVATSTVTFFRSMGGTFGVAIFGAIFASGLAEELRRLPPDIVERLGSSSHITPERANRLPPDVHDAFLHASSHALHGVFLWGALIAVIPLGLSWLLKEIPLRTTIRSSDEPEMSSVP